MRKKRVAKKHHARDRQPLLEQEEGEEFAQYKRDDYARRSKRKALVSHEYEDMLPAPVEVLKHLVRQSLKESLVSTLQLQAAAGTAGTNPAVTVLCYDSALGLAQCPRKHFDSGSSSDQM